MPRGKKNSRIFKTHAVNSNFTATNTALLGQGHHRTQLFVRQHWARRSLANTILMNLHPRILVPSTSDYLRSYHEVLKSLPSAHKHASHLTPHVQVLLLKLATIQPDCFLSYALYSLPYSKNEIQSQGFRSGERGGDVLTSSPKTLSITRKIVCSVSCCTFWLKIDAGSFVISVVRM
jgi:hypothetical protein